MAAELCKRVLCLSIESPKLYHGAPIHCLLFRFAQSTAESLQRADGLFHSTYVHVELRRDGYDLHPLEGSVDRATGLHDRDQRALRTHVNQIPARLDDLDRAGHRRIVG